MHFLLFIFILSFCAVAQSNSQPPKESTDDLRAGIILFSIEDLNQKAIYWLERTASLDHYLRMNEGKNEKILKVSSKEARKMEMDFATKFLKCQYELPPSKEDCKVTLRLTMKGDSQDVCVKDEEKAQEMKPVLKELEKRF